MENSLPRIKPKTIYMNKHILFATALFASSVSFAQQKEKAPPPPPPPPPSLEAKELPPPPPPPPVAPTETVLFYKTSVVDYSSFLDRNKEVKSVEWYRDQKVSIHLKSGGTEVYDLKKKEDLKKMEDKYGALPEAPPPPPAPKINKQQ